MVVGSGPNGLAAAITLQQAGRAVLLLEGKQELGGGLRTAELTLHRFRHDICSAIYLLAVASPFFQTLPLGQYGLEYLIPPVAVTHPFDDLILPGRPLVSTRPGPTATFRTAHAST